MALNTEQRRQLLNLARAALHARVRGQRAPDVPSELNTPASGAFVTAYHQGELRGCLGTLESSEPLGEAIVRLAGDVAQHDYRFPPIGVDELDDVTVDISVLTSPEPVTDPTSIEVGRDGLIVSQGARRGLLLPQVAPEHGWDRETFLAHTCMKAGLPPDAWRRGARIERFQAEVFGEDDYANPPSL
jgi:AmmeMemoRadiSam system protein A